ncbi:MAG: hypothetical protein Q4C54_00795 [Clostridia bacterium]|nr:hypothetical protein [Clostridia bacterium]
MKGKKKIFLSVIIAVSIIFVAAMFVFALQNGRRVTGYNQSYLADNTLKAAQTIDENLSGGFTNIRLISQLVSGSLDKP